MTIRDLVTVQLDDVDDPESVLRRVVDPVVDFDDDLALVVQDLADTMDAYEIAIGLAAPQIGVSRAVAIIDKKIVSAEEHLVVVNPSYDEPTGQKDTKNESCLSLPPWSGPVLMRKKLIARFQTVAGEQVKMSLEGFPARVFRHEADHLKGGLYVDYVEDRGLLVETDIFD